MSDCRNAPPVTKLLVNTASAILLEIFTCCFSTCPSIFLVRWRSFSCLVWGPDWRSSRDREESGVFVLCVTFPIKLQELCIGFVGLLTTEDVQHRFCYQVCLQNFPVKDCWTHTNSAFPRWPFLHGTFDVERTDSLRRSTSWSHYQRNERALDGLGSALCISVEASQCSDEPRLIWRAVQRKQGTAPPEFLNSRLQNSIYDLEWTQYPSGRNIRCPSSVSLSADKLQTHHSTPPSQILA